MESDVSEIDDMEPDNSDLSMFVEALYPLHPIASEEYQYHYLLALIFSYLPFNIILKDIFLVNSHFQKVAIEFTVVNDIKITENSFKDVLGDPLNHNSSDDLYLRFEESILKPKICAKSISMCYTIFRSHQVHQAKKDYGIIDFDPKEWGTLSQFRESYSQRLIIPEESPSPSVSYLWNFSVFDHFFSKVVRLELLSVTSGVCHVDMDGVTYFLNNIPTLKHLIIHDFVTRPNEIIPKVNSNSNVEMIQLRCRLDKCEIFNSYYNYIAMEKFVIELYKKCEFLSVLEVPNLRGGYFAHCMYYDDRYRKLRDQDPKLVDPLPMPNPSEFKMFMREKFLDPKTSSFRLPPMKPRNILNKRVIPLFYHNDAFRVFIGNISKLPCATAMGENCLIVDGVPFLVTLSLQYDHIYAQIKSPFAKYSFESPLDKESMAIPNTNEDGMGSLIDSIPYGGRFVFFTKLFHHSIGGDLESVEPGQTKKMIFNGNNFVPLKLTVHKVFKTFEIEEGKRIGEMRRNHHLEMKKQFEMKSKMVKDSFYEKQIFSSSKKSSTEFRVYLDEKSLLLGNSSHFFTLFDDMLDFRWQYDFNRSQQRRGVYVYGMYQTDICFLFSYSTEIWIEKDTHDAEGEEKKIILCKREITTSMQYLYSERGWGFEFLLPEDLFSSRDEYESSVRVKFSMEIFGNVMTKKEWEESHQKIVDLKLLTFPMREEKELHLFIPNSHTSHQTGIVSPKNSEDPRLRTLRLCGIDFTVEFINFGYYNQREVCGILFNRVHMTCQRLKIKGTLRVKVLDRDSKYIIGEHVRELYPKDIEYFVSNLCNRDVGRKKWKFLVSLELKDVEWEKAEEEQETVAELVDGEGEGEGREHEGEGD